MPEREQDDAERPDVDQPDADRGSDAPICACGVTALPAETAVGRGPFVCENPDCEAFGSVVGP